MSLKPGAGAALWAAPALTLALSPLAAGCARNAVSAPTPRPTPAVLPPHVYKGRFADVTEAAGIRYVWKPDGKRPLDILQTIGNGAAFLDYDGDGNLDILLVGSPPALYRGDGKGHFTDVTKTVLPAIEDRFLGCAVGDYDNDGFPDAYLSAYRGGRLLHNEGGKRFTDVTGSYGIPAQAWGSACAFGDVDGDGKPDLYIGNYVEFTPPGDRCFTGDMKKIPCGPQSYKQKVGALYLNRGKRFEDVTEAFGAKYVHGKTLGATFAPLGGGRQSLALANDTQPTDLLLNRDGKKFEFAGKTSGLGYGANGRVVAGMGMDWGDYDNDGRLDLAIMTFADENKEIFRDEGEGLYADYSERLGVAQAARQYVAFGCKWLDFDNDGWLDLMIANGHTSDIVDTYDPAKSYRNPVLLFRNEEGRRFADRPAHPADFPATPIVGRGLATGDYDNDGRMDAIVTDCEGRPLLLHNETERSNQTHWLMLRLTGGKVCPRDGTGAIVTLTAGDKTVTRHCHTDGSYFSASDGRVHFGLGGAKAASVTIRWPDGATQTVKNVTANQILTVKQHSPIPEKRNEKGN